MSRYFMKIELFVYNLEEMRAYCVHFGGKQLFIYNLIADRRCLHFRRNERAYCLHFWGKISCLCTIGIDGHGPHGGYYSSGTVETVDKVFCKFDLYRQNLVKRPEWVSDDIIERIIDKQKILHNDQEKARGSWPMKFEFVG